MSPRAMARITWEGTRPPSPAIGSAFSNAGATWAVARKATKPVDPQATLVEYGFEDQLIYAADMHADDIARRAASSFGAGGYRLEVRLEERDTGS
jgi:hypothetical protein